MYQKSILEHLITPYCDKKNKFKNNVNGMMLRADTF